MCMSLCMYEIKSIPVDEYQLIKFKGMLAVVACEQMCSQLC